jgi:hypothetical protein
MYCAGWSIFFKQLSGSLFSGVTSTLQMIHIAILVLWTSFKKIDGIEQVNLDFETEEDMKRKFQVGLALQPVRAVW